MIIQVVPTIICSYSALPVAKEVGRLYNFISDSNKFLMRK